MYCRVRFSFLLSMRISIVSLLRCVLLFVFGIASFLSFFFFLFLTTILVCVPFEQIG
jgi:hypothetical protein